MREEELEDLEEALASPKEPVRYAAVRALANNGGETPFSPLLRALADESRRVRREAVEILAAAPERVPVISALTEVVSGAAMEGAREAAAEGLLLLGKSALNAITRLLSTGAPEARRHAAVLLGDLGESAAVPSLATALVDRERKVRLAAAEALGKIGSEGAAKALAVAVESMEDLATRLVCLDTLALVGAIPPVHVLMESTRHRALRRVALRLLARSERTEALPICIEALRDPARVNRESAVVGIQALRSALSPEQEAEVREVLARDAWAVLRTGLRCPEEEVFRAAAHLVAWVGATPLAAELARHLGAAVRRGPVLQALESLGEPALEALRQAATSATAGERAASVEALAVHQGASALPLVRQALADPHPLVAAAAARALGSQGGEEDLAPLVAALARGTKPLVSAVTAALRALAVRLPEATVRLADAHTFGQRSEVDTALCQVLEALGGPAAPLREALRVGAPQTRRAAALALGTLGDAASAEPLRLAMEEPDPALRAAALEARVRLAARLEEGAVDLAAVLSAGLADPVPAVQVTAARALAETSADEAFPALVELATHSDEAVALTAVATARKLADGAHLADRLAVLETAIEHEDPEVVRAAVAGLAEIGAEAAVAPLSRSLDHPRFEVRIAAIRALERFGDATRPAFEERLRAEDDPLVREVLRRALREREPGKRPPR